MVGELISLDDMSNQSIQSNQNDSAAGATDNEVSTGISRNCRLKMQMLSSVSCNKYSVFSLS